MKQVILSLTLDGPIPAVTKQDIAEQSAEKLKNLDQQKKDGNIIEFKEKKKPFKKKKFFKKAK